MSFRGERGSPKFRILRGFQGGGIPGASPYSVQSGKSVKYLGRYFNFEMDDKDEYDQLLSGQLDTVQSKTTVKQATSISSLGYF